MDVLEKFIRDNDLLFSSTGSELNSDCTIISGFALYQNKDKDDILAAIKAANGGTAPNYTVKEELNRVFKFAKTYHYGAWWHSNEEEARLMYEY